MSETDKITIVNVDDQDAPRYVKTRDLQENGFTVIEARTGAEALRVIEAEKPPVVLLDVELPDITGYDVCIYIKKKWPGIKVGMWLSHTAPGASAGYSWERKWRAALPPQSSRRDWPAASSSTPE